MNSKKCKLNNGFMLLIREAREDDAKFLIDYVNGISSESNFLTFGEGEFDYTEQLEREFIWKCKNTENQLFLVGLIGDEIVSSLNFSGGQRPRTRHSGEFSMSVKKAFWGNGIGSCMLDSLLNWAKQSGIINKINLRVRTDNNRGIALYKHKGFTLEGTIRREICVNGQYFDLYWMGLTL